VRLAAFSPDGRRLATAANWGEVRLWELSSPPASRAFTVRSGDDPTVFVTDPASLRLTALAWDPSGRRLAVGTGSGATCVFETRTGRALERYRTPGAVQALALPETGPPLVVTESGEGYRGARPLEVTGARRVLAEGGRAAFLGERSVLLALPDGRRLCELGRAEVGGFWEGRVVAAGTTVTVADALTGRRASHWKIPSGSQPLAVSGAGDLALAQGHAVRVFDAESGQPVSGFLWHLARIQAALFTGDRELATLAGARVRVFQAESEHGYRPQWTRAGSRVAVGPELAALASPTRLLVTDAATGTPWGEVLKLPALPDFMTFGAPEEVVVKCGRRLLRWTPLASREEPKPADVVAVTEAAPAPPPAPAEPEGEEPEAMSAPRVARVVSAEGREVRDGRETFRQATAPRALGFLRGLVCLADERHLQIGRGPHPQAVIPGRFEWLEGAGDYLVAGEKRRLVLVEARDVESVVEGADNEKETMRSQSFGKVGAAAFTSDILCHAVGAGLVLVGLRDGTAQAFWLKSPLPVLGEALEHQAPVVKVALGPGLAATADAEGRIYMWTLPQAFRIFASRPGVAVTDLAFAPSGDLFVSVGGKTTCWRFPARVCAPDEAERFAERLTGFSLDARQMLRPLSPQEWRERAQPAASPAVEATP